ncbi:M61 family metallopeptidase [Aquimarina sp. MMG015]|uniref:M61 family metallopeptidase n=1 Tax=unclassified Aquimarina TaxID=2627091 RepID=UPI000E4A1735|nr:MULTISPECIES: PDZ domain-containing protein [unclassified Aquimarina]AXT55662.1 M61 family peptidase [Aquimarina sp. AD1]MBQ4804440.1 M61 family metallopeptidase [Aquimarina sp. MMG015]RKN12965.1 PDZ domain-containing protein [Aquimarina sp. AD1]
MKSFRFFLSILFLFVIQLGYTQVRNEYQISFENAVHHEAKINAVFTNLESGTISLRMSRTSPGRYALHEFAKNVYDVKITDSKGKDVTVTRPNPYQWDVSGHDGTLNVSYILFADRGDGTYSQIDETHAHLNMPATFMYVPTLKDRPVQVTYQVREDLNWKVATQLIPLGGNAFLAPNLQYFMDSPAQISNHTVKEFKVASGGTEYTIKLALLHQGTEEEADQYFEQIKKIVEQEKAVFGDYPNFDYGEYTFLASYMPQVSGDGMEHRNSTVLTSTLSLADGGMKKNIGTVAHEFFHAWNVERIRPISLEPFDFENANMSGELWFAEGFTSYYTNLILCRAGIITQDQYIAGLSKTYNYVWNSPALQYFNPIEMSYQAPFVDAASSIDPTNRDNTFISYYSYGSMLGLALDLSLRDKDDLNLDDYLKLVWTKYGKTEIPYTIENLFFTLREYAGESFADDFFEKYIFDSQTPDFKKLLGSVAIYPKTNSKKAYLGADITFNDDDNAVVSKYVKKGTPAYTIGLAKGDVIVAIDNKSFSDIDQFNDVISKYKPGKKATLIYRRLGVEKKALVRFGVDPTVVITQFSKPSKKALLKRENWLKAK